MLAECERTLGGAHYCTHACHLLVTLQTSIKSQLLMILSSFGDRCPQHGANVVLKSPGITLGGPFVEQAQGHLESVLAECERTLGGAHYCTHACHLLVTLQTSIKSHLLMILSSFGDRCPQHGGNNVPSAPRDNPRRAFCGLFLGRVF